MRSAASEAMEERESADAEEMKSVSVTKRTAIQNPRFMCDPPFFGANGSIRMEMIR